MTENNFLSDLLSDPDVMAQVTPLLGAAIDDRIAPLVAKVEQLAQGVTLIAQGMVEQAQQQPQTAQPPAQQPPQQFAPPEQQPMAQPQGIIPTPPQFGQQPAAAPSGMDKFASLAPLLMQYLNNQQSGNGSLSNIAETLSAAAAIGNVMNQPMLQGMRMATDMMSLAGRAGIEPTVAAETLGKMVTDATETQTNTNGANPSG